MRWVSSQPVVSGMTGWKPIPLTGRRLAMRTVAFIVSVLIPGGPVVLFPQTVVSGEPARLSFDLDKQRPLSKDLSDADG